MSLSLSLRFCVDWTRTVVSSLWFAILRASQTEPQNLLREGDAGEAQLSFVLLIEFPSKILLGGGCLMLKSKLEKLLNDPPESDLSFRDSMSLTHCPGSFPFPPLCHHPTLASVASSTPLGTLSTLSRGHVNTTHGPPLPMSLGSTQKPCPHPIFLPSSN